MRTVDRDIVSALIFSKDGKLFQGKKNPKDGGVYVEYWHIPGGGIEAGEDPLAAIIREVKEEVGLDISPYEITLVDDVGTGESLKVDKQTGEQHVCRMKFLIYQITLPMDADEVPVVLASDLAVYHWIRPEDIVLDSVTPPSQELFKRLGYV